VDYIYIDIDNCTRLLAPAASEGGGELV